MEQPALDPAIRSIRIATTLAERFGEIIRGSVGQQIDMSSLELKIGEAQQIYPEIWRHLDDARTVIAGRGAAVAAFDAIRTTEGPASLGVSRVEVESYSTSLTGDLLGIADEQLKTATFNIEGHRKAVAATKVLMAAMPEVDWQAVARKEAADLAAVGSIGQVNARSLVKWALILGVGVGAVFGFWFLVVRTPPVDHAAERERSAAALKVRIATLRAEADASPCAGRKVQELIDAMHWDVPPGDSPGATARHYKERCTAMRAELGVQVTALREQLDATPCDTAKLTKLDTALREQTGSRDYAADITKHYNELCSAGKAP